MEAHRSRILFFAFTVLSFLSVVLYRLFDLQVLNGEKFLAFSEANSLREIPIPAPRGKILDRNGIVLAENRPKFVLTLHLPQVKDWEATIRTLTFLTDLPGETVREILASKKNASPLLPWTVVENFSEDQVARLRVRMTRIQAGAEPSLDLRGLELALRFERVYPFREKIGHVLGYLREIGEKEWKAWEAREPGRVSLGDFVGVAGAEKAFDSRLRGRDGFRQILVDAMGREADLLLLGVPGQMPSYPATPGENLRLTLDSRLMETAFEALRGKVGALVALDPRDGAVLAWLSTPSYDPTELSGELSPSVWTKLKDHPDKILLNRPAQAAYPPGSTHKILTALAALASGKIDFKETIRCPGYYQLGNRRWGCWNAKGHGRLNLKQALVVSCDVFFYKLGERLGPDPIAAVARLLGLGAKTGILADSEREGILPTVEWKSKSKHEAWTGGDSLGTAIGQGFNLVTPVQNALMIARFANGGKKITPHLLLASDAGDRGEGRTPLPKNEPLPLVVSPEQYEELKQALVAVVNAPGGTGASARLKDIRVAGKTGTAQVIGHDFKGKVSKGVKTEDHAWFVAYAPEEDPEIALAVLVEHGGGGGGVAAPIAKQVLEAYFQEKTENREQITENR